MFTWYFFPPHLTFASIPACILCPSRELASQIYVEVSRYSRPFRMRVAGVFGGMNKHEQFKAMKAGTEVMIGTPGRVMDLFEMRAFTFTHCSYLVIDEADKMLWMGFEEQVRSLVGQIRPDRQTLLFTATLNLRMEKLAASLLRNPIKVQVGAAGLSSNANVVQRLVGLSIEVEAACDRDRDGDGGGDGGAGAGVASGRDTGARAGSGREDAHSIKWQWLRTRLLGLLQGYGVMALERDEKEEGGDSTLKSSSLRSFSLGDTHAQLLIFVATREGCDRLSALINRQLLARPRAGPAEADGPARPLHGDRVQAERSVTIKDFKVGTHNGLRFLLCICLLCYLTLA